MALSVGTHLGNYEIATGRRQGRTHNRFSRKECRQPHLRWVDPMGMKGPPFVTNPYYVKWALRRNSTGPAF